MLPSWPADDLPGPPSGKVLTGSMLLQSTPLDETPESASDNPLPELVGFTATHIGPVGHAIPWAMRPISNELPKPSHAMFLANALASPALFDIGSRKCHRAGPGSFAASWFVAGSGSLLCRP